MLLFALLAPFQKFQNQSTNHIIFIKKPIVISHEFKLTKSRCSKTQQQQQKGRQELTALVRDLSSVSASSRTRSHRSYDSVITVYNLIKHFGTRHARYQALENISDEFLIAMKFHYHTTPTRVLPFLSASSRLAVGTRHRGCSSSSHPVSRSSLAE